MSESELAERLERAMGPREGLLLSLRCCCSSRC